MAGVDSGPPGIGGFIRPHLRGFSQSLANNRAKFFEILESQMRHFLLHRAGMVSASCRTLRRISHHASVISSIEISLREMASRLISAS